jgi:hypothetical protein
MGMQINSCLDDIAMLEPFTAHLPSCLEYLPYLYSISTLPRTCVDVIASGPV